MAILIDEARWWFRGRRWCHLVSDASLDELHEFAAAHGIPAAASRATTTTCPRSYRPVLIAGGAEVVPSRELLRRLARRRPAPDSADPAPRQFTNEVAHPADRAGT